MAKLHWIASNFRTQIAANMDDEDFDSDSSDEDYVPTGAVSDGDQDVSGSDASEDLEEDGEENVEESKLSKGRKQSTGTKKKKKLKSGKKIEPELEAPANDSASTEEPIEEDKTKRADSLWADFMKDVGTAPKPKPTAAGVTVSTPQKPELAKPVEVKADKVVITKVYEFAGEEVRVTKEVDASSQEAKSALSAPSPSVIVSESSSNAASASSSSGQKRPLAPVRGGLASITSALGAKKNKISTLEKSKLDWDSFKKAEDIEEDLKVFNQGKSGYLERQDFLQRTDLKQFEIERNLRLNKRSNR